MESNIELGLDNIIDKNRPSLIKHTLSSVSTDEILSFLQRINFYTQHFSIIYRRNADKASECKLIFLENVRDILNNEVEQRKIPVTIKVKIDD